MNRLATLITLTALAMGSSVSAAAERFDGPLSLNQWVRIADDGSVTGTVVVPGPSGSVEVVPSAVVTLSSSRGESFRVVADRSGRFVIDDIVPGVYSMIASDESSFACYAFHVVGGDQPGADRLPTDAELVAAKIPGETIRSAITRYLPARLLQASVDVESVQMEQLAESVRHRRPFSVSRLDGGLEGLIQQAGAAAGKLVGAPATNVFLFQDGVEIARTVSGGEGAFRLDEAPLGEATLIAVGQAGIAVVGIELLASAKLSAAPVSEDVRLVAAQTGDNGNRLVIQAAPLPSIDGGGDSMEEIGPGTPVADEAVAGASGGGGGGFGGGGGGGGGFGGGGFGGIAAMAGIGVAAAVSSDDDDEDLVVPPPASPVIPSFPVNR